jgi:hypothetical protein
MSDHSHFEELTALAASGLLSYEEQIALRAHAKDCAECRETEREFRTLVHSGLPQTMSPVREFMDKVSTRRDPGIRSRFLQRARREGIRFSPDVEGAESHPGSRLGLLVATATGLIALIIAVTFHGTYWASRESTQAKQQVDQLKRENSELTSNISQLNSSLTAGQREIQNLRAQLGNATAAADNLRRSGEQASGEEARSSSQNAELLDETRNQEKLLAEAKDDAARINQLHVSDEAALVQEQLRIADLSNRLRIASATLDLERRLVAEGKDVRELMASRELHVIDVRDSDSNGNPGKAFGRVFLMDGKSLTFYGFDLNEDGTANAKGSFQVWAVPEGNKNSSRSLGILRQDAKAQGRWVLNVENPELAKDINSVFVTVEPLAGGNQPSGRKMLYAYLGQANHP